MRRIIVAVENRSELAPAPFRLAQLEVNPLTGEVRGPGGVVRLEPRVLDVLLELARRHGQLVPRGELLQSIWPGGEVYDEALTQCVYQLRQQLVQAGGDASCRDLVATVPKRGYLLKGRVDPIPTVAAATGVAQGRNRRFPRTRMVPVAAIAIAALVVAGVSTLLREPSPPPAGSGVTSLAVLPFLALVEAERDPALELGMADTLITRLSSLPTLVVRPMSSVRQYEGARRDALEAGRALGVETVLEGSLQRSGDTLRVSARLLRVADGTALWAETLNGSFADVFAVQDELCARIAASLAPQLGVSQRAGQAGTADASAYEHYLRGRYHLARLSSTDLLLAAENFRRAVALDPGYVLAWLGLASVEFRLPLAGEAPPAEHYPLARSAAERALELDPAAAEGHAMLGWIAHWYDWNWAASEAHFQRALDLDPRDTEAHLGYAHLLSTTGRNEEAVAAVRRAREISPFYPAAAALEGLFLLRAGRPGEAVARLEQARSFGEGVWLLHASLAGAYAATGRFEKSLEQTDLALAASDNSSWVRALKTGLLVRLGRQDEARSLLDELLRESGQRYVPPFHLAVAHRALGEPDASLALLQRAFDARDPKLTFLGVEPWPELADRPAYREMVRQMHYPDTVR